MKRSTKIVMNRKVQGVYAPEGGDSAAVQAPMEGWSAYFASSAIASETFMDGVEDLHMQERAIWI